MKFKRSQKLFAQASQILPGGVDSPVRAFKSVGGTPIFIKRASGATIEDADGNRFIDYVMSWGPLIHGHAPRGLVKALSAAAVRGTSFGAPSALEIDLGERVRGLMPSLERVRFVNSGTEAAMSAVRVARAAWWSAGPRECAAGPDLPRQNQRRRAAGRRIWRPRGSDGNGVAGRSGLPGGNLIRQPAGDDCRDLEPRSARAAFVHGPRG